MQELAYASTLVRVNSWGGFSISLKGVEGEAFHADIVEGSTSVLCGFSMESVERAGLGSLGAVAGIFEALDRDLGPALGGEEPSCLSGGGELVAGQFGMLSVFSYHDTLCLPLAWEYGRRCCVASMISSTNA